MNIPSAKSISEAFKVSACIAEAVREVMMITNGDGDIDINDIVSPIILPLCTEYSGHDCMPATEVISKLLPESYGGEYIQSSKDSSLAALGLEYVNMGDTYKTTVLYDRATKRWRIGCWGDMVERHPTRFGE